MVSTVNSTTSLMALLFFGVATLFFKSATAAIAAITEGPVSVTAPIGTDAQFHCAGTGNYLVWVVDGLQTEHPDIVARGITAELVKSSGKIQSNLTVPATSVNNGTNVRCSVRVGFGGIQALSDQANLTVLQGVSVGHVLNLRFSPSFTTIMWDPPATAGVLSGLTYHLTVTMDTGVVITNSTTTDTSYTLGSIQYCVNYTANVAVLHTSATVPLLTMARTPGSDYILQNVNLVVISQNNTVSVSFIIYLKLPTGQLGPCKSQKLFTEIRFQLNNSAFTKQEQIIEGSDITAVFNYSIPMNKSQQFTALISIGDQNKTIFYFSIFAVQHCDVHTDHTSYILVECTFAINSTAPGFVLIQDEHSQYTINTTLKRHDKGSVNITDLPTGEYNVTVYDEMKDYLHKVSPAFTLSKALVVVKPGSESDLPMAVVSPSVSPSFTTGSHAFSSFYNTATPTLMPDQKFHFALLAAIPTGMVFVLISLILVIGLYILFSCSGKDRQQVDQPAIFLRTLPPATNSSDGNSTDSNPQNAPPNLLTINNEEKSAHIASSDDKNIPAGSTTIIVDIPILPTTVSEVHELQDPHHCEASTGSGKAPEPAVHDPKLCLTSDHHECKQQDLALATRPVDQYISACAQGHMCDHFAAAIEKKAADCQATDYGMISRDEVGPNLGKDNQDVVPGYQNKETTKQAHPVYASSAGTEELVFVSKDGIVLFSPQQVPPPPPPPPSPPPHVPEHMQQALSNNQSKIATPSLTTSTSSGYKSEEKVPEGGKYPTHRKYVPSNCLGSSKTTATILEQSSVPSSELATEYESQELHTTAN